MKRFPALLVLSLLLALALPGTAQSPGGSRDRSRPGGDLGARMQQDRAAPPRSPTVTDPMMALERELPSLRTDLKLNAEQQRLWDAFERGARDAAEMSRARLKRMAAIRDEPDKSISAVAFVNGIAGDDIQRAEAMKEACVKLQALYETLSAEQKALLDRRVLLAQKEPLGSS
jgi:hypothetical protein